MRIMSVLFLMVFMSFNVNALDSKPTPSSGCNKPPKGCRNDSVNATCSRIACKAEGCVGDYSSGKCKDLSDEHKAACEFATGKCGEKLPASVTVFRPSMDDSIKIMPRKMKMITGNSPSERKFNIRKDLLLNNQE